MEAAITLICGLCFFAGLFSGIVIYAVLDTSVNKTVIRKKPNNMTI